MNALIKKLLASVVPAAQHDSLARRERLLLSAENDIKNEMRRVEFERRRNAPDVIEQVCFCARHDRSYIVEYTAQRNGRYLITASRRIRENKGITRSEDAASVSIPINIIDGSYKCPYCSAGGQYFCRCGVICGGRVKLNVFYCRNSCGRSWLVENPAEQLDGTRRSGEVRDVIDRFQHNPKLCHRDPPGPSPHRKLLK